ncbi:MAG TPA: helicase-related protein [Xanthobacteraceae bacterium]|jgi:ATP-dependent RNA helicase SUPV3L1/SUV3|nr:helicase-related protein [Xanthobacteraceae bacterium]
MPVTFAPSANRDARARGVGVTAVLGPTNTGKTHLAIERMLAHSSGLIGLPLRLLAREVYNKVAATVGAEAVALVTGEEKIKPANPRFWVSTVEAMPRDLDVAFLAVDEVQLGADLERGHVFTDRMLHRRGREETLVLGAGTMRPMVERLLPGANIVSRARLSRLTYAGEKKLTRLPRRSAIVAFSADEVYAIAELIRRQRGGAAVVLGALSPRARNAQVALYQSGDVDHLVATDAIGMGLNLDVDHVAFASDRKFDGYQFRRLTPAEFGQIAGRAGRHTRDGTFGTTGRCPVFEPELVEALESHAFESVKVVQWRNSALDFKSLGALQASLATVPTEQGLTRAPIAEDIQVLEHAARDDDVRAVATSPAAIEQLWDVCQVPDYRKIAPAAHAELVVTLYGFLRREGRIPVDWFSRQVALADRTDGDIDTLSTRIAHIRTWTFAANRPDWLADPEHWQGVTRAVEDKLSDALHERLIERFVDRRTSVLMRRLRENTMLETEISKSGEVVVEGHPIGRLEGFQFAVDPAAAGPDAKALRAAAQKALAGEIDARAARVQAAPDEHFVLAGDGAIRWMGEPVGKLIAGDEVLRPRVRIVADEHLTGASRDAVQARLDLWVKTHLEKLLGPLFALAAAEDVTGIARGVAFQLVEALGVLERHRVADDVKGLDQAARATLRKYGVRFGAYHIYLPGLLKPAPRALATQLWALKHADPDLKGMDEVPHLAASGRTSFPADKEVSKALYRVVGYRVCGERAVRVDILERLADLIRPALAWKPGAAGMKPAGAVEGGGFTVTVSMTSLTGASGEDFASVLRSLGYRMERRPKPPEPEAQPSAPATEPALVAAAEGAAEPALPSTESGDATPAADAVAPSEPEPPAPSEGAAEPPVVAAASEAIAPEPPATAPAAVAAVTEVADPAVETAAASAAPAEEAFIEIWRPGRPEGARPRPRGQRRPPRAAAQTPSVEAPRPAAAAPEAAQTGADAAKPAERPQRPPRPARKPRSDRPPRPAREGGLFATSAPKERRDKAPDPNSPFAKLAALKEQLEANAKERR